MSILNVVDEKGKIIGEDTRENIHRKGLLHREIHVWFYTPNREIIFQLRGKNKDTFPNLLDATVGGHVEVGDDFESAAIREVLEETGVNLKSGDLLLIDIVRKKAKDPVTDITNNALRKIYACEYGGYIIDLDVERDKGQGFEAWPIDKLIKGLPENESKRFIPSMISEEYLKIYKRIGDLTNLK